MESVLKNHDRIVSYAAKSNGAALTLSLVALTNIGGSSSAGLIPSISLWLFFFGLILNLLYLPAHNHRILYFRVLKQKEEIDGIRDNVTKYKEEIGYKEQQESSTEMRSSTLNLEESQASQFASISDSQMMQDPPTHDRVESIKKAESYNKKLAEFERKTGALIDEFSMSGKLKFKHVEKIDEFLLWSPFFCFGFGLMLILIRVQSHLSSAA